MIETKNDEWNLIQEFNHKIWKWKTENKLNKKQQIKIYIHGTVLFALAPYLRDLIMTHHIIEIHSGPDNDWRFEKYDRN